MAAGGLHATCTAAAVQEADAGAQPAVAGVPGPTTPAPTTAAAAAPRSLWERPRIMGGQPSLDDSCFQTARQRARARRTRRQQRERR